MEWLTKSDYMKFLIHPAYLWLAKHAKNQLPEFDELAEANVNQGYAVEAVAQRLFPGAHLIDVPLFDGPQESARLMRVGGPDVLLQASVLTDRQLYVRADVLVRQKDTWDLCEIKGSAAVKPAHLLDLAFQRFVFEEAGHKIRRSFVVHIDGQYVRRGALDPSRLFKIVDVTEQTGLLALSTAKKVAAAQAVLRSPVRPSDAPELAGDWYGYRDVYAHLHPEIQPGSLYRLTRLSLGQIKALAGLGVTRLTDIPDDFGLGPQQAAQVALARSGRPHIQSEKIAHELDRLIYPLHYLDYETFASALPLWDGVRPFQQLPFQYSLHIQAEPGGALRHQEYLARGWDYPVAQLLERLQADFGSTGSVIVWNKAFEMGCNDAMATLHPQFAGFLADVNARVYDLMEIFSNGYYGHPDFQGSASIKKVLPVLVPELSYKDLGIGEGLTAQVRWMKAARGELSPTAATQVYNDLVTYCGQDTLAMVRILQVLRRA